MADGGGGGRKLPLRPRLERPLEGASWVGEGRREQLQALGAFYQSLEGILES